MLQYQQGLVPTFSRGLLFDLTPTPGNNIYLLGFSWGREIGESAPLYGLWALY